ncbi:DUF1642 domain-containing protein [Listeria seeligeri]|uniref:DUF1642 domain-containing protein n=1 Tax=Listeria seeligeri TaxID=1640 RepID=UPI00164D4113|nr:DUF1642 domain-containing protein [Listeria seeligeri]EBF5132237.1 DUF1642 domain-containing protein [Listeria monocytogenes]MBC6120389.1 DUF1642 domain-containing protein [Listeria seeligeri]
MSKFKVGDKVNLIIKNKITTGEISRAQMKGGVEGYLIGNVECWTPNAKAWREEGQISAVELPEIPQFVADNIEKNKREDMALYNSLYVIVEYLDMDSDMYKWLEKDENVALYAEAWIKGYEIEKEQLYYVRILKDNVRGFLNQLNYGGKGALFIDDCIHSTESKTQFTKEEVLELDKNLAPFMVKVEELEGETW